jgi:sulfite reductase alpha subunit-like flavoprotein
MVAEHSEEQNLKLYILHDSNEWMIPWRPVLDSHFGKDGYVEWLLDGTGESKTPNFFDLNFDFGNAPPQGVFFCKGSGSSHLRGLPHARDCFTAVLQWLEYHGRLVVNGERAFAAETSKVSQLVAMSNFGLHFAKTTAVFGTGNLVMGASAFLKTLGKDEGFWIRFNRAGCGRGICLCKSTADVESFLQQGMQSPDEIYILQQAVDIPAVVRMEFSFGRLLYGMEIRNVHNSTAMAPCGCLPQIMPKHESSGEWSFAHMCTALVTETSKPFFDLTVSRRSACGISALAAICGTFAGTLLPQLAKDFKLPEWLQNPSKSLLANLVPLAGLGLLVGIIGSQSGKAPCQPCVPQRNPIRLLKPDALKREYPLLTSVAEKVKPLMSDFGAATLALDVVIVEGQAMILDINIHTNYAVEREKESEIAFEDTGYGSACLGLSSLLRDIEQSADLDLTDLPSDNLVFGIGLPKTGTHSLAEALKVLGYRGRHNSMLGKRAVEYTPKTRQFAGYFHVDSSHCRRYDQLFRSHPNARFIISTRLDEDWKESMERSHPDGLKDVPMPNQYLSEVLRFFVNHHATHRLMVCNLFSEPDELLWSKLIGFLPLAPKYQLSEQPFPRIVAELDGRISKASKVKKSPSKPLLGDFSTLQFSDSMRSGPKSPRNSVSGRSARSGRSVRSASDHSDSGSQAEMPPSQADSEISHANRVLSRYLDYKSTYLAKFVIRPDNAEVAKLTVLENRRLTPEQYDRHIFHLALKVEGTGVDGYDAGDCIGLYAENPADKVNEFISSMGFDGTELLELDSFFTGMEDGVYVMSCQQICQEYLELFGAPTRGFYLALSKFAQDIVEKEYLAELSLPRKSAEFEAREALAVTHASTILEFSSVKITPMNLLDVVPLSKPRLYSIASSRHKHPGEVHLLVVTHTWENSRKEEKVGLATGYLEKCHPKGDPLASIAGGTCVVANLVRSPVLKLPKESAAPVIMAGMGTGMAPFRGFIEERSVMRQKGQTIGPMRLYFGARHKKGEYLYQNELEAYAAQGWLTMRCAWSRDQKAKIYVQMLIEQDDETVWEALKPGSGGAFYICGPIQPLPDIKKALVGIFTKHGLDGAKYLDEMEATGRFATEVY